MEETVYNKNRARAHIWVSGQVQGVFFRDTTKSKAEDFGLTGWVRNLPDGRVEVMFEGDREVIEKIIEWSKQGPDSARVENVEVKWEEYKDEFGSFTIRH